MLNIRRLESTGAIGRPLQLVINCRRDRVERNAQMGALVATVDPQVVFLIGDPTKSARNAIPPDWPGRVVDVGGRRTGADMLARILDVNNQDVSVVAVGNIHGQGEVLLEELLTLERMPIRATATEAAAQAQAQTAIFPVIRVGGSQ